MPEAPKKKNDNTSALCSYFGAPGGIVFSINSGKPEVNGHDVSPIRCDKTGGPNHYAGGMPIHTINKSADGGNTAASVGHNEVANGHLSNLAPGHCHAGKA